MEQTIKQNNDKNNDNYDIDTTRAEESLAKESARMHSSTHIAAFVLGIIATTGSFFWYISVPCGILAIVFGAKSSRALASKLGKAGLILGIVGISLTIFIYVSLILITLNEYHWYYY